MTHEVEYCLDDQEVTEVTRNMGDIQVRRLPVLNHEKRLIGIRRRRGHERGPVCRGSLDQDFTTGRCAQPDWLTQGSKRTLAWVQPISPFCRNGISINLTTGITIMSLLK